MKTQNGMTNSYEETIIVLLKTLLPDDDLNETQYQKHIRNTSEATYISEYPNTEFDITDLHIAIDKLKIKRAPGYDNITSEIIKQTPKQFQTSLLHLFNKCLSEGKFPRIWKRADVIILRKSLEKPRDDPTSYRPICLLPVLGKILDSLLATKITKHLEENNIHAEKQYGFRANHCTDDAIHDILKHVNAARKNKQINYNAIIFIDIKGAFDNAWWPHILNTLRNMKIPENIYKITQDYFRNRTAVITAGGLKVEKKLTKGCPQGSVSGPVLWTVLFTGLLETLETEGIIHAAYADDLAIVINGTSRSNIETEGTYAINVIENWCTQHKLQISQSKTKLLLTKGKLDRDRKLDIKIEGKRIDRVKEFRYLGVTIDETLSFLTHVENVTRRAEKIFSELRRLSGKGWATNRKALGAVYTGAFTPIISYACSVWAHRAEHSHIKRRLNSSQRIPLTALSKAYSSTAKTSLQILTGKPPLHLGIQALAAKYWQRKGLPCNVAGEPITTGNNNTKYTQSIVENAWQKEWDTGEKGRTTYSFIQNVNFKNENKWFIPNFELTQFITGHGDIKHNLKRLNLITEDECACGEIETVDHMITTCEIYNDLRHTLSYETNIHIKELTTDKIKELIKNKNTFTHLQTFTTNILKRKKNTITQ